MARSTSISSTARPRRATPSPPSAMRRTASASLGSCATAGTKRSCALDLALFINGLPVATFELKNSLTKQTVDDAVEQYKRDRDPRERLFEFGRCVVHFAVDEHEVRMLYPPQGQGVVVPAVQPGLERRRRQPAEPARPQDRLSLAAHPHARRVSPTSWRTTRRSSRRRTRRPAARSRSRSSRATTSSTWCGSCSPMPASHGAGRRYLIQHSAGSGKSNSIAWLAHQLIGLRRNDEPVFDSILVVTDRRILDQQIRDTIKRFAQVGATVGACRSDSGDLREVHRGRQEDHHLDGAEVPVHPRRDRRASIAAGRFAIIIDEAHSSQGGTHLGCDQHGALRGRSRGRRRDDRGRDQPHHGIEEAPAQRELLRLYRDPQGQDAGDLRRGLPGRRQVEAPPVPQSTP